MPRKIVIIGANAAGVHAANAVRKTDSKAQITLIDKEPYPAYSRCGIPYVLAGEIPSLDDLTAFPPSHYRMMKFDLRLETEARSINPNDRIVLVENKEGNIEALKYDSLILATGADPFIIPMQGHDLPGVFAMRTMDDGKAIQETMKTAERAIVIGAGFIGLETAHAFAANKIKTTIIEVVPYILPALFDEDMADYTQKKIEEHGVDVVVGRRVEAILGKDKVEGVSVAGEEIDADVVVMAAGIRPRTDLIRELGVELGVTRAIRVNPRMETSVSGIFAAGDCVESQSDITGLPCLYQLGTNAVRQGTTAGVNAAGGYAANPRVICSAVSKIFDFELGAVGLSEFQAAKVGFKTLSATITGRTRAHYFPGGKEVKVKIVAEPILGRVMGAQIIGGEAVAQRINMLSVAIQKEMTALELSTADTSYAPPVAETVEPVATAAEIVAKKIRRR
ncbi:pyridine nucleotide-disulfide oxidoreductase [Candidatus Bathyarchaeota archaeon]|nr:MAG: pyridine nucleotide-disulfide oxidoreductase [Candidatus Bathyarchaeota archaeon]